MSRYNPIRLAVVGFGVACALLAAPHAQALEIAFEPDSALPLVDVNFAIKAGSVTDPAGQGGLTNFVGEMLLRGTRSKSKEQIDLALDQMGARLDVEVRAEALILRGAVLRDQLPNFLSLVDEIVTQPSFPDREIAKLKSEVTSQILEELGHDPSLSSRRFVKFLFRDHPYGKPVLGNLKDVAAFKRTQLIQHYGRLFRGPNLLVVGAGDATENQITSWAKTVSSRLPQDAGPGGDIGKVDAPQDAPAARYQIIDKPERTQTQINGGQIGMRMTDAHFFPFYLGNHAFGGGSFAARLMVEIRVKRGWSYGANSYLRHGRQPRSWQYHLFPASKDTVQALALTQTMVRDARDKGISQGEFEFARDSLINSAGFMYNTPKKRVENKLLERTLDLPDGFMKSYATQLSTVTLPQVNAALHDFLKPDQLAISVLGTAKDLKPAMAKALGISEDQIAVVPFTQE